MDKIVKHQFWILICVAALLPPIGWWIFSGAAKADYETRSKNIDGKFGQVPDRSSEPNKNWSDPLIKKNEAELALVKQTQQLLWNRQTKLMTWPDVVKDSVGKVGYRSEIGDAARSIYQGAYQEEVVNNWQILQPLREDANGTLRGLVWFPFALLPNDNWRDAILPPSSEQMWNSQEDVWMYRTLLSAINTVHKKHAPSIPQEAPIRELRIIELRGGNLQARDSAAPATPAGGGAAPGAGAAAPGGTGSPDPGGATSTVSRSRPEVKVSFNPDEDFGSDALATEAGGGGGAAPTGGGPGAAPGGPTVPMAGGGDDRSRRKGPRKRYIEENDKFKTRGFYMELVMDQRRLPDLLESLANSPWPLRVTRVHQVDHDRSDLKTGMIGSVASSTTPGGFPSSPTTTTPDGGPMSEGGAFGPTSSSGGSTSQNPLPLDDPHLVDVAIDGYITIYLPPPVDPAAGAAPEAPAAPGPTPEAAPPATTAAPSPASPEPAAAEEPTAAPDDDPTAPVPVPEDDPTGTTPDDPAPDPTAPKAAGGELAAPVEE